MCVCVWLYVGVRGPVRPWVTLSGRMQSVAVAVYHCMSAGDGAGFACGAQHKG